MKEELGFFSSQDPHPCQVQLEGTNIVLVTTSTRVSHVPGLPAPMHTSATSQVVERITPGSGAPSPPNLTSSNPHGLGIPTASTIAPATVASNYGGVVTPVNVFNLHCALQNHPNREFVNKLYFS